MKKRNLIIISLIFLSVVMLGIGLSYSYFRLVRNQDNTSLAGSKCFKLELSDEKNEINLTNMYPISDEEGKKLTPYSFTITNTCDMLASYTVNMEMLEGTTLSSKYLDVMVNNEEIKLLSKYEETSTVIENSTESRILARGTLAYNDSVDYTVRFWMDKDVEDVDAMNKYFASKIVIVATPSTWNPKEAGYGTLHDAILANEYQSTPEDAMNKIEAKGTPDLSKTAPMIKFVEKKDDEILLKIVKPSQDAINSDELTSSLDLNDTLMRISKTKNLDTGGGRFRLNNQIIVDPTILDYSGDTKYYYSTEYMAIDSNKKLYTAYNYSSYTVYEIISAVKEDTKTSWNNKEYSSITYSLTVKPITAIEIETDSTDKGIYVDMDDYGSTFYYRGNVKNNNVVFAGYKWKIMRINGDSSIRLIYNGTLNDNENKNILKTSYFNEYYDNPGYFGYMYGTNIGNRADNIKNEVSSTIKLQVDDWYEKNIKSTVYEKYLSDSGFCSDREIYSGDGESVNSYTHYLGSYRTQNNVPSFKCTNIQNDLFTLKTSSFGNKSLDYSIGLPSIDELLFSGAGYNKINKLTWTYSENSYWTMTPSHFNSAIGADFQYIYSNFGYIESPRISSTSGIRPVINLKSDVKIAGGIGTVNEPFIVDTN